MFIQKYNKGFSLVELMLVLAVATIISYMKFQEINQEQESLLAKINGEHIKKVGDAVNSYIEIRYDKLSLLVNSAGNGNDPGPRTCSGNICTITYETLINEGLLPKSFNGINLNKSAYTILLKREGINPNYIINGLITTNNSWNDGELIRYDLLGHSMKYAGIDSGMSREDNKVYGLNGMWSEKQIDFNNINKKGLLAYRVGYNAQMYSIYLRRDGTLPMTGDLDMGKNNINNIKNINADGDVNADSFNGSYGRFSKNVGISGELNVLNAGTFNQNLYVNSYLNVKNGINSNNYISAKTQNSEIKIGGGGTSDKNMILINLNGENGDGYISLSGNNNYSTKLDIWGSQKIRGNLTINASNDGKTEGSIFSSGNISSEKTVSGQYLQVMSTSINGHVCLTNGMVSKDVSGKILSCVNGKWESNKSDTAVGLYIYTPGKLNTGSPACLYSNSSTGACSCPTGTKSVAITSSTIASYEHCSHSGSGGDGGGGNDSCSTSYYRIYACMGNN